jgi:Zn-dependent protease with chaperone function
MLPSRAHSPTHEPRAGLRLTARVVGLGLLGYAYVVGVLACLVVLTLASLVLLPSLLTLFVVTLPLGGLTLILIRALWVGNPGADGVRVRAHDAPELFTLVDAIRADLQAPRVHEVRIVGSFTAALGQAPRLGLVGPSRNTLVIGLPLLQALPPEEAKAVLAHEVGHLSRRHGRLGGWAFRSREKWARVDFTLGASRWTSLLFGAFLRWFIPRFDRATFALAQAHEFEADRASVQIAGPDATASALVRTVVGMAFLDECVAPKLWKRADVEPTPPGFVSAAARELRGAGEYEDAEGWVIDALDARPEASSTHPTLRERLEALGFDPERVRPRPAHVSVSAAEILLGPELTESLSQALDERMRELIAVEWEEQHEGAHESAAKLSELEAKGPWRALPAEELAEYAGIVSRLHGVEAAEAAWERVLELEPASGSALLALGEIHAKRGDPDAVELLERAARIEPAWAAAAHLITADAHAKAGRRREAAEARHRAEDADAEFWEAMAERSQVTQDSELASHDLSDDVVASIAALFDRKEISRAYLARKVSKTLEDRYPVYVIGYVRRSRFGYERRGLKDELNAELSEALDRTISEAFWLVDLTEGPGRMLRRIKRLEGSLLVSRGRTSRPLARVAPVFLALLLLGGVFTRFADDEPVDGDPGPPQISAEEWAEIQANSLHRWASSAEDICSVYRTHAQLRLEDVRAERGELNLAETWDVVRPFELEIVTGLERLPHVPAGGPRAIALLRQDVARLDRAARAFAGGRAEAAQTRVEEVAQDRRAEEALAGLGIHSCSEPNALITR